MKKVVVCGAGIGGLATALHLKAGGANVRLFEKNDYAGGKMGVFRKNGYRFDTGPSLITMPHVLRDFFKALGKNMDDYIELKKLDISCRYFWEDGTVFNWYSDHERLLEEISDVFGSDETEGFRKAMNYGKLFFELSNDAFLEGEFKLRNFVSAQGLKHAGKFISGRSMNDVSNKFFRNPKFKQLWNRFATYNGSSPYLSPQFFSIIPYTEHLYGPWYVKGGIYRIAEALSELCTETGIEVAYSHKLKHTETSGSKVSSLTFETPGGDMTVSDFDTAVMNFTSMQETASDSYFKNDDWSSSGFIMFSGMRSSNEALSHHNIFFSQNYENEFLDIFERHNNPADMTVYVSITSKSDSLHAPTGNENWFMLVNVPSLYSGFEWNSASTVEYSNRIFEKLNSFTYVFDNNVLNCIEFTEAFTPLDFMGVYGSEYGSIYGLSSNSLYTLMKRPKNRSAKFSNLYFCGGNSHPGGGVPLVFLSGKITAGLILGNQRTA